MTITSQLAIVEPLLENGPTVLLGSSLGGYLATLLAERHPEQVAGLVLFAPAFGFARRWETRLGPAAMARWRSERALQVYHYGVGPRGEAGDRHDRRRPDLSRRARGILSRAGVRRAAGRRRAARRRRALHAPAHAERHLVVLDAGHELTVVLEPIWQLTHGFLASLGAAPASEHRGF